MHRIPWLALALSSSACGPNTDLPIVPDASVDAGSDAMAPPIQDPVPELYPADQTLSPITPYVVQNLRAIAARAPDAHADVFAKLGDSATVSSSFMHCFDDGYVGPAPGQESGAIDLDGRDHLRPTIAHFRDGDAAGATPYRRLGQAAGVGFGIDDLLAGEPSRQDLEYQAIEPLFAVVAIGVNDVGVLGIDPFGSALLDLVDQAIAAGVIPVLTALPPRTDDPALAAQVPSMNALVRGVAQARQVPFIDLHRALLELPGSGLGPDGVRPSVYRDADDIPRPCAFHPQGLDHGYNVRNLLTIQTLDRLLHTVVQGETAPDPATRTQRGQGTAADPYLVDALPYAHLADTSAAGTRAIDTYPGCQANQNESGPELLYRLDIDQPTRIRAAVVDRGATDIDIHLLAGAATGDACAARDHRVVSAALEPGTYYLSLDTFFGAAGEQSGEYLLTIVEESP